LGQADGNVWRAEFGPGEGGRPDKGSAATKKGEPTAPAAASLIFDWWDGGVGAAVFSVRHCCALWKGIGFSDMTCQCDVVYVRWAPCSLGPHISDHVKVQLC
jgi:hypothetical protein